MKSESDVVEHVVAATGVAESEVRRVIEAAFGFLRSSALAGEGVSHPSLGVIRVKVREVAGADPRTVYRFEPDGEAGGAGTAERGAGKGAGRAGGGGRGKAAGPGRSAGRGRRRGGEA